MRTISYTGSEVWGKDLTWVINFGIESPVTFPPSPFAFNKNYNFYFRIFPGGSALTNS